MTDVHEPEVRSYNMSRIRSKDTRPEMIVRKFLHRNGFRYRLHVKELPGKPDIVLPKYKTAIFVNGCFWHGHENCKRFRPPKSNQKYWSPKIENNIRNDQISHKILKDAGYFVLVVWECQLNSISRLSNLVKNVKNH